MGSGLTGARRTSQRRVCGHSTCTWNASTYAQLMLLFCEVGAADHGPDVRWAIFETRIDGACFLISGVGAFVVVFVWLGGDVDSWLDFVIYGCMWCHGSIWQERWTWRWWTVGFACGVESHRCVSQANYCSILLAPMQFCGFQDLKVGLHFFLGESKSLPGRGAKDESEAIGRH